METGFRNHQQSRSLPEVVGQDCQTCPDCGPCRAFRQHSIQTELAFKHADRCLYAAAKPLQLPKPRLSLMYAFCFAQPAHLRDSDFFKESARQNKAEETGMGHG